MLTEKILQSAEALENKQGHPKVSKKRFRPSEAGKCRRFSCYRRLYTEPANPPGRLLLFQDGNMHHNDLRTRLALFFELKDVETTTKRKDKKTGVVVVGHPDCSVQLEGVGKVVVEIKGVNHFFFQEYQKTGKTRQSYRDQNLMYQWLLGAQGGIILIKNKNTSAVEEFYVERDKARIRELLNRFADCARALAKDKVCKRDYTLGSRECSWCSFNMRCWGKKATLRQHPVRAKPKVIDLSDDERGTRLVLKQAIAIKDAKAQIREAKARADLHRIKLLRLLSKVGADQVVAGAAEVTRKTKERITPNLKQVRELVEGGLIGTSVTTYDELTVEIEGYD